MKNTNNIDVIERFRALLDDNIEDMESYVETDSNKLYLDELFDRLLEAGSKFLLKELERARVEERNRIFSKLPSKLDPCT